MAQSKALFIGIGGSVVALDRSTGEELWRSRLKAGDFTNVVLDNGDLYASSRGQIFCLDPATGAVRWRNKLAGLGWGLVTIAGGGGSQGVWKAERDRQAAEAAAATSTT